MAPMSMIKKQYEKAIIFDEVNKILQDSINQYINDQKLDILGNPLPVAKNDIDWDSETLTFDFELGFTPKFNLDLTTMGQVVKYNIVADDKMLDEQIGRITESMGKIESQEAVEEGFTISAQMINEEEGIDKTASFKLDKFANEEVKKSFLGKKAGDIVTFNTKGLFADEHELEHFFNVSHEQVHGLAVDIQAEIKTITKTTPAELNQEVFDRVFGKDVVQSAEDFRLKLKEDAENQLRQQADQQFLNDVTDHLIKETKIDLPKAFLTKWIQFSGERALSADEALKAFEESENGFKYQLLENKIVAEHNLQVTFEEIKNTTADRIKMQYAQYGINDIAEDELNDTVMRVLKNKEEMKRLSDQLLSQKMIGLYLEKVPYTTKDVTFEQFLDQIKK
jgi:trigger factor